MGDTATPKAARDHARAQAGTVTATQPTIPASSASDLPEGVVATDVVWDETIGAGGYASKVVARGARIRLTDLGGDGCANVLLYNAANPAERLNVADTVKVQWQAYLGAGMVLLSDMGRVMASIVADTSGVHDALCGASNRATNAARYGDGSASGPYPNARDRFVVAAAKHGLDRRDVMPSLSFFKGVRVAEGGALEWVDKEAAPGSRVELRAEMDLLVIVVDTPHVLDPRDAYVATPVRITAWRGTPAAPDDPVRLGTPEVTRAFENTEDLLGAAP